jgi:hypothetical protein
MSETACPACGANGVTACDGLGGKDHPGRPPYFDARTEQVLDIMAEAARSE